MSKDEFVSRVQEDLERKRIDAKCRFVSNPYFEYVRECKTRKRRQQKRNFYR